MLNLLKKIFGNNDAKESNISEPELPLKIYNDKIEISKYSELYPSFQIIYSSKYSYITPPEILEKINSTVILWIDIKNDLLGFSSKERTLIFKYSVIKSFHISNILPAKGRGASYFSIRLSGGERGFDLTRSSCNAFDSYPENIIKTIGIQVIFDPEEYDC